MNLEEKLKEASQPLWNFIEEYCYPITAFYVTSNETTFLFGSFKEFSNSKVKKLD